MAERFDRTQVRFPGRKQKILNFSFNNSVIGIAGIPEISKLTPAIIIAVDLKRRGGGGLKILKILVCY